MSNQEILEKAIRKAVDNGWDDPYREKDSKLAIRHHWIKRNETIFNHDFAKALWGDGLHKVTATYRGQPVGKMSWQYHLQMMVLADDPIKYLAENI